MMTGDELTKLIELRHRIYTAANSYTGASIHAYTQESFSDLTQACDRILSGRSVPESELLEWRNLKDKIEALANNSKVVPDVNLGEFPDKIEKAIPGSQVTIGDLHGNALKLIYTLIRQGMMTLEKGADDYNILVKLYLQSEMQNDFTPADFSQFIDILKRAKVDNRVLLRLIGDELYDRGNNDVLTLAVLARLAYEQVPLEILFSNHGYAFLEFYENNYEKLGVSIGKDYINSIFGLIRFLKNGILSKNELNDLVEEVYLPNLKIISYSINESDTKPNMTIFSHASIGIMTIKNLAQKFDVPFMDNDVYQLANTIDKINEKFAELVIDKAIVSAYEKELKEEEGNGRSHTTASPKAPILKTSWFRLDEETESSVLENGNDPRLRNSSNGADTQRISSCDEAPVKASSGAYDLICEQRAEPATKSQLERRRVYTLNWVHGHDGFGQVPESQKYYVRNLDNVLGKYLKSIFIKTSSALTEPTGDDYAIHYNFETTANELKRRLQREAISKFKSPTLLFSSDSQDAVERKVEREIKKEKERFGGESKAEKETSRHDEIQLDKEEVPALFSVEVRNPRKLFREITEKILGMEEKESKEKSELTLDDFNQIQAEVEREDGTKDKLVLTLSESDDTYSNLAVRGKILIDIIPPEGKLPDKASLEAFLKLHNLKPLPIEKAIESKFKVS